MMVISTRWMLTGAIQLRLCTLLLMFCVVPIVWADKPVAPDSISGITTVTTDQSIKLILNDPELIVIDARLIEEYRKGHIEGAVHLVDRDVTKTRLAKILPNSATPVLFYCNGPRCLRSSRAAKKAQKHGYSRIYWYRDGWADWIKNELPIAH